MKFKNKNLTLGLMKLIIKGLLDIMGNDAFLTSESE